MCSKERPSGCQHSCPLACHPDKCPPCKQRLRMRCHCNTQVIYSDCQTFTNASDEQKEKIKSCGKACVKKVNSQNEFSR
jgi:NF-X1-type zinc finger protein NFXL1